MFGKNEIVGQKYFKEAPKDSLMVTSMFYTLQGEGPYSGMPAYFIRLSKCNLACRWCDTFFDQGDYMTYDEIFSKIRNDLREQYRDEDPNERIENSVLVMTGGEPTLQENLEGFLKEARMYFGYTQIESNGILNRPGIPYSTTLIISPKCVEKRGKYGKYIKPNIQTLERADCLKFVMENNPDSPYNSIPDWAFEWKENNPDKDIYISPMNVYNDIPKQSKEIRNDGRNRIEIEERSTKDEVISFWEPGLLNMTVNEKNHKYVAEYCMKHNFRMQLQVHLYAGLA